MDFSKMTGYEFEDYIAGLLTSLGFSVSATPYSGDGGIDLIAERSDPFFSGKYLIQCKNWASSVGQPQVRDLYGVVMSERANKGILITTSDFTDQAYEFAEGKNVELISGGILQSIISDSIVPSTEKVKILSQNNFNQERYRYLNNDVHENPKIWEKYVRIINFLRDYFWAGDFETCKQSDIFSKIIEICVYGLSKNKQKANYPRMNDNYLIRKLCTETLIGTYTVSGELGKATDLLLRTNSFYITEWNPDTLQWEIDTNGLWNDFPGMRSRNLYAAYKQVKFEQGCKEILSKLQSVSEYTWMIDEECNQLFENAEQVITAFLSGIYDDSYYYTNGSKVDCSKRFNMSKIKKHFFKKSDQEIRNDILRVFVQHNISISNR